MKKVLLPIMLLLAFVGMANAQTITTVAAARALTSGTVTLKVIITNGKELGLSRYFQDATGGFSAYLGAGSFTQVADSIKRGDSVLITGTISAYATAVIYQLSPVTNITVLSSNNPLPIPTNFTIAQIANGFAAAYDCQLIRINGATSMTTTTGGAISAFAGNTNYRINNITGKEFRVNTASTGPNGIVGKSAITSGYDVIGITTKFKTNYQLLVRNFDDFVLPASPNFVLNPYASNIQNNSLDINFNTDIDGNSVVYYGTSPTSLTDSVVNPILASAHTLSISGLTPATIYYVKAYSKNAVGTGFSRTIPVVTKSLSTGKITTYFTGSVNNTYAYAGNNAVTLPNTVDDTLIAYINRAKATIDIAIYNWNNNGLSNMSSAVNAAYLRGVQVRIVADGSTANLGLASLNSNIGVIKSPTSFALGYTIMHNKFVVIDANNVDPNVPIVWTGSTNWTQDMMKNDYNNVIIFQDQSLARVYKIEFEEMFGSSTLTPGAVYNGTTGTAYFGNRKTDNTPHNLNIGGKAVECYFSPSDGTNDAILKAINSTNSQFQTANLIVTRTDLAYALRNRFQVTGGGCSATLLDDTASSGGAVYGILSNTLNTRLKINPTPANILHHKYLIVDSDNQASDPLVLTGSHNWSNAGNNQNDENTVVVHDISVANQFYQEVAARMIEYNMPAPCLNVLGLESDLGIKTICKVYPNPATNAITIKVEDANLGAYYTISDITGRNIASGIVNNLETNVSTSNLTSGVYFVKVKGTVSNQTVRLAIQ